MKKGFTILELLVASVLLGMLVTILTSIFNQSSIAWRTATVGVADLDDVRDNMAEIREEADNAFVWNKKVQSLTGLWDENGQLRKRACDAGEATEKDIARVLRSNSGTLTTSKPSPWTTSQNMISVGRAGSAKSAKNYTVNVKSAGPDRVFNTWDDVWSWPDEFD